MDYNTQREKLILPEYGRHVQKMVEQIKNIEDREKRSEQARAIIQIMGLLNPQVRDTVDYRHKLWDHIQMIAGFELDVDAPYPLPEKAFTDERPQTIPIETKPVKAACYGRNIENMINLIAGREEDEAKNELIRRLAIYMRQQYLIWNKDSVADSTIFSDIERLSDGKLKVPEGMQLGEIANDAVFSKPGQNTGQKFFKKNRNRRRKK